MRGHQATESPECSTEEGFAITSYVFWNLTFLLSLLVASVAFSALDLRFPIAICPHTTLGENLQAILGWNIFGNSAGTHLWFVRCLMLYILISPALYRLASSVRGKWLNLILFLIVGVSLVVLRCEFAELYRFLRYRISLEGLLYFYFGIGVRLSNICLSKHGGWMLMCGLFFSAVKVGSIYLDAGDWIGYLSGWLMMPCVMYGLFQLMPETKLLLGNITRFSFSLYLIHPLVIYLIAGLISASGEVYKNSVMTESITFYFIRWWGVIFITLAIAVGIRRLAPNMWKLMLGGRE